jgi:hypothetical protein
VVKAYCDWFAHHLKHEGMAIRTLCLKDFDVSNAGEAVLNSHAKGSKHTNLAKQRSEESIFQDIAGVC